MDRQPCTISSVTSHALMILIFHSCTRGEVLYCGLILFVKCVEVLSVAWSEVARAFPLNPMLKKWIDH